MPWPDRLTSGRYIAEPKLDGQRAQVRVARGRTVHVYARPGRELLALPGFGFLRELAWPVDSAILDGETGAGDGHEGIQSVFAERGKAGGAMAVVVFDVLHLDGHDVMREPWRDRRKRLDDLAVAVTLLGVAVAPTTGDARGLWDLWVHQGGGAGILLKEPGSLYYPGQRSPAWLKPKARLTLDVVVMGESTELVPWGRLGPTLCGSSYPSRAPRPCDPAGTGVHEPRRRGWATSSCAWSSKAPLCPER